MRQHAGFGDMLELRQRAELRSRMSTLMNSADELPQPDSGEPQEMNGWKIGDPFFIATPREDLCGTVQGFRFICGQWYGRVKFENGVRQGIPLRLLRKVHGA